MQTFRKRIPEFTLPMSSAWLLNDIAEFKVRQDLYTRQSPLCHGPGSLWQRKGNPA